MEIIETNLQFGNMDTRTRTERIILHHAEASSCTPEQIHQWHLERGWAGAGYHFLVRKDGTIYRLRPEDKVGAHAYGSNYNSIGICAEGSYMEETMPDEQKNAIAELIKYLQNKYNMNIIQKHKDVCSTSCPGDNYPFDEIVNLANNGIETNEIEQINNVQSNTDNSIASIQSTLNSRYGVNIVVDGIYGKQTRQALVKGLQMELNRQRNAGLVVDGIFGNNTYNACINVKNGASGNITYLIQAMLVCKGFNPNGIDGIFGRGTSRAVRSMQYAKGLIPDAIVGKETFSKL